MNTYLVQIKESGNPVGVETVKAPNALTATNQVSGDVVTSNMEFTAKLVSREVWYAWSTMGRLVAVSLTEDPAWGAYLMLTDHNKGGLDAKQVPASVPLEQIPEYIRSIILNDHTQYD